MPNTDAASGTAVPALARVVISTPSSRSTANIPLPSATSRPGTRSSFRPFGSS